MLALPGDVLVRDDKVTLFAELGEALIRAGKSADDARGVFHLALSGGSTPKPFYDSLANDPAYRELPWSRTHIWIVDERRVPEDSDQSNIRMIRESLTDPLNLPASQVHAMPVLSDDPALQYEAALQQFFQGDAEPSVQLDFVLLGMGDDCHTASLFPNSAAIQVADRLIVVNEGEHVTPPDRVTMTYTLLNDARRIAVLCLGEKKLAALQRVAALPEPDAMLAPISAIRPTHGELIWFLDAAAAGE